MFSLVLVISLLIVCLVFSPPPCGRASFPLWCSPFFLLFFIFALPFLSWARQWLALRRHEPSLWVLTNRTVAERPWVAVLHVNSISSVPEPELFGLATELVWAASLTRGHRKKPPNRITPRCLPKCVARRAWTAVWQRTCWVDERAAAKVFTQLTRQRQADEEILCQRKLVSWNDRNLAFETLRNGVSGQGQCCAPCDVTKGAELLAI